jgi:hypothetical protein
MGLFPEKPASALKLNIMGLNTRGFRPSIRVPRVPVERPSPLSPQNSSSAV